MTWTATLGWAFTAYALLTGFYIALENRRPQATLAWMLLFLLLPGAGLAVYLLFGRDRKAFSRERELARQDLRANPNTVHFTILMAAVKSILTVGCGVRGRSL